MTRRGYIEEAIDWLANNANGWRLVRSETRLDLAGLSVGSTHRRKYTVELTRRADPDPQFDVNLGDITVIGEGESILAAVKAALDVVP